MIIVFRLATLCAALIGTIHATNSDDVSPMRKLLVNMKTTAINRKNRLCPACFEVAGDLPQGLSFERLVQQYVPDTLMSDRQLAAMYDHLTRRSVDMYDGNGIPEEMRGSECTTVVRFILASPSVRDIIAAGNDQSLVPQATEEYQYFILDKNSEINCEGTSAPVSA